MRLTFLGTAAANTFPEPFCACANCRQARQEGGVASAATLAHADATFRRDLADYGLFDPGAAAMLNVALTMWGRGRPHFGKRSRAVS